MDLNNIKDPSFLKELDIRQLNQLSSDIREFLITNISKTGGHLSSNLGVVELTIALHYVFNSPKDKIFFDVVHQSYVHKILTGRANRFDTLRKYNGLSGFQKQAESKHFNECIIACSTKLLRIIFAMCKNNSKFKNH